MFRLVQFVNTLTTSYWYISGAQYKIQDVSIFSPRSNYQAFQGFHTSSLSFSCNNPSDNVTYEIMAAFILHLILYSLNENWKEPLKSSIKAKRCCKNWKNLKALRKKLGLYQLLDGSWRGWYQLGLKSCIIYCQHVESPWRIQKETRQIMRLIQKRTYLNGCAFGRWRISE